MENDLAVAHSFILANSFLVGHGWDPAPSFCHVLVDVVGVLIQQQQVVHFVREDAMKVLVAGEGDAVTALLRESERRQLFLAFVEF